MDVVVIEDVDDVENVQHLGIHSYTYRKSFQLHDIFLHTRCECEAISHRHRLYGEQRYYELNVLFTYISLRIIGEISRRRRLQKKAEGQAAS
jgi:hypothetical protein